VVRPGRSAVNACRLVGDCSKVPGRIRGPGCPTSRSAFGPGGSLGHPCSRGGGPRNRAAAGRRCLGGPGTRSVRARGCSDDVCGSTVRSCKEAVRARRRWVALAGRPAARAGGLVAPAKALVAPAGPPVAHARVSRCRAGAARPPQSPRPTSQSARPGVQEDRGRLRTRRRASRDGRCRQQSRERPDLPDGARARSRHDDRRIEV